MTDKERIEEMARDLCDNEEISCDDCLEAYEKYFLKSKITNKADHCEDIRLATKIYNAGYRKIPEGSVVLSMEEFDEDYVTKQDCDYWKYKAEILGNKLKQARKETARAFVEFLTTNAVFSNDDVNEFAKQFGVEIKE
jgi:hypothetical protein